MEEKNREDFSCMHGHSGSVGSEKHHHHHHHHHHHRRHLWFRFKKTCKLLCIVAVICLFVSFLFVYITGNLPDYLQKISTVDIENTIRRLMGISGEEKINRENLKNLDYRTIVNEFYKGVAGWEGDRGERQVEEKHKKNVEGIFGHGSAWENALLDKQKEFKERLKSEKKETWDLETNNDPQGNQSR